MSKLGVRKAVSGTIQARKLDKIGMTNSAKRVRTEVKKTTAGKAGAGFKHGRKTGNTAVSGRVQGVASIRGAKAGVATRGIGKNKKTAAGAVGVAAVGGGAARKRKNK